MKISVEDALDLVLNTFSANRMNLPMDVIIAMKDNGLAPPDPPIDDRKIIPIEELRNMQFANQFAEYVYMTDEEKDATRDDPVNFILTFQKDLRLQVMVYPQYDEYEAISIPLRGFVEMVNVFVHCPFVVFDTECCTRYRIGDDLTVSKLDMNVYGADDQTPYFVKFFWCDFESEHIYIFV